jgi:DNA-binding FadR family transcriptional regulator
MHRDNVAKKERDELVKVAHGKGIKVRRSGRTVKQQLTVLKAALKTKGA